ncbi:MAG: C4-type zinc ribbon domain-containing protein [Candidatus Fermentibacteria bacterium]
MIRELEKLISLHDLDIMISDLVNKDISKQEKKLGLSPDSAATRLRKMRDELSLTIDRKHRDLYDQLAGHYGNAVVPVISMMCSGCFTQLPTAFSASPDRNDQVETCPSCGRFIYWCD